MSIVHQQKIKNEKKNSVTPACLTIQILDRIYPFT